MKKKECKMCFIEQKIRGKSKSLKTSHVGCVHLHKYRLVGAAIVSAIQFTL